MTKTVMPKPLLPSLRYIKVVAAFYLAIAVAVAVLGVFAVTVYAHPLAALAFVVGILTGIATGLISRAVSIGDVSAAFSHAIHCD